MSMKKVWFIVMVFVLMGVLTACNSGETKNGSPTESSPGVTTEANLSDLPDTETVMDPEGGHILIAYFSHTGNTEMVATVIAEKTGGELFRVMTVNPYPEDYDECVNLARQEQEEAARPELSAHVDGMDNIDVVFLGYPNWLGTLPMPMLTFLEEYDFSGKTIIPFCTYGGSGLGRSIEDVSTHCPDAIMLEGLGIPASNASNAQDEITQWLERIMF